MVVSGGSPLPAINRDNDMTHLIMVVTKKPNKPATVNDDMFTGTEQECVNHSIDMIANILEEHGDPIAESCTRTTSNLYWGANDSIHLLVVPTTNVEIK